jgi:hypothetical protein
MSLPNLPNFYSQSNNLGYGLGSGAGAKLDPQFRRGRSVRKPSLSLIANILMMGRIPTSAELAEFNTPFEAAASFWQYNVAKLTGRSILGPNTPSQNILVLPNGAFEYTVFEDAIPSVRRFACVATTKTVSGAVITFYVSAANSARFNVDDQLVNWSNSETLRARVTSVDTATGAVTIVAHGGTAFSAVTDFFVSTTSLDVVEVMAGAKSPTNPTVLGADQNYVTDRDVTARVYTTSLVEDLWVEPKLGVGRGEHRAFPNTVATEYISKQEALLQHLSKISSAALWSKQVRQSASSNGSTFNGIDASITTNRTVLTDGALGIKDIDEMLIDKLGGTHASEVLYGFCSFETMTIIENLFMSLGAQIGAQVIRPQAGEYAMPLNIIRYRGREIHIMPVADFNDGPRTFANQSAAGKGFANKLYLINPESPKFLFGTDQNGQSLFFKENRDLATPAEAVYAQKHGIMSQFGLALYDEDTNGVISGIEVADISS